MDPAGSKVTICAFAPAGEKYAEAQSTVAANSSNFGARAVDLEFMQSSPAFVREDSPGWHAPPDQRYTGGARAPPVDNECRQRAASPAAPSGNLPVMLTVVRLPSEFTAKPSTV